MQRFRRPIIAVVILLLVALIGYTGYVGWEGSRQLVEHDPADNDCRTPDVLFGWSYEAINYDKADDALLKARNPAYAQGQCTVYQGTQAGTDVVTDDGIHIAGWYIPAADGAGPTAPTVVLAHGFHGNKSGILKYGQGLHAEFNLVAFDFRNVGRSTGDKTSGGVLEQKDIRAILDWLERTKHPSHIGVLGNSFGSATAFAEAVSDPRVEAIELDSMHTRWVYQVEARISHAGHPAYPGTWAVFVGVWIRTGTDLGGADAEDALKHWDQRPILLVHGTKDNEDLPARTQAFYDEAKAAGRNIAIDWCPGSGHNANPGHPDMPTDVCAADFKAWTHDFFTKALG